MNATSASVSVLGWLCEIVRARFGGEPFDRHYHDVFSIGFITSGTNASRYRRGRFEAVAGTLCVADPGETHDGGLAGVPWSYINLYAPPGLLGALAREEGDEREVEFQSGSINHPATCALFARFLQMAADQHEYTDEVALMALGELVRRHGASRASHPPASRNPSIAARAIEIMTAAAGAPVSLDMLARETGSSRYRVIRAVSAATGLTPVGYMTQLRVDRAKALIRCGTPIAEAALEAGFADQPHLTRAMKRRWGYTPGALRNSR